MTTESKIGLKKVQKRLEKIFEQLPNECWKNSSIDVDIILSLCDESANLAKDISDRFGIAKSELYRGIALHVCGMFEHAEKSLLISVKYFREHKKHDFLSIASCYISLIYFIKGTDKKYNDYMKTFEDLCSLHARDSLLLQIFIKQFPRIWESVDTHIKNYEFASSTILEAFTKKDSILNILDKVMTSVNKIYNSPQIENEILPKLHLQNFILKRENENLLSSAEMKIAGREAYHYLYRSLRRNNPLFFQRLEENGEGITSTEAVVAYYTRLRFTAFEIAEKLSISKDTVDTHQKHLRSKLGVTQKYKGGLKKFLEIKC